MTHVQYIGQYIEHIAAGCLAVFPAVSEHTVQNSKNQKKIDKIFKIKKKTRWQKFKMADIVMDYTKKNVWMPPVHPQHKESMLCQTKGHHMPPYV